MQDDKPKENFEKIKFLREEIRFEYSITAQRVSWYLVSQSFLISAFVLADGKSNLSSFQGIILPLVGVLSSLLVRLTILVSYRRILGYSEWVRKFIQRQDQCSEKFPFCEPIEHYQRDIAMLYAKLIPIIFGSLWLFAAHLSHHPIYTLLPILIIYLVFLGWDILYLLCKVGYKSFKLTTASDAAPPP